MAPTNLSPSTPASHQPCREGMAASYLVRGKHLEPAHCGEPVPSIRPWAGGHHIYSRIGGAQAQHHTVWELAPNQGKRFESGPRARAACQSINACKLNKKLSHEVIDATRETLV